jgi:hypothetical protein
MANAKISALTSATTPLAGTEVLPIVQSSTTKKVSAANLTSGRSVGVLDLTINDTNSGANYTQSRNGTTGFLKFYGAQSGFNGYTFSGVDGDLFEINNSGNLAPKGNLVPVNGKGIDFSATAGTGTSELLADYEEGTWTPGAGAGLVVVGTFSSSGTYTKVGRIVTLNFRLNGSISVAFTGVVEIATGLPFTVFSDSIGAYGLLINANANAGATIQVSSSSIFGEVNSIAATTSIYGSVTYMAA